MSKLKKCKCGKSAVDIQPVGEDLWYAEMINCHMAIFKRGVITFVCDSCFSFFDYADYYHIDNRPNSPDVNENSFVYGSRASAKKIVDQIKADPTTVRTRKSVEAERLVELTNAILTHAQAKKQLQAEWIEEYNELRMRIL